MEKDVLNAYVGLMKKKYTGKRKSSFLEALKKKNFHKTIASRLSGDIRKISTGLGRMIKYDKETAPHEITEHLRNVFLS